MVARQEWRGGGGGGGSRMMLSVRIKARVWGQSQDYILAFSFEMRLLGYVL